MTSKYVQEFLRGSKSYINKATESVAKMEEFLNKEHDFAAREGFYTLFDTSFPNYFHYKQHKQDFMKLVKVR